MWHCGQSGSGQPLILLHGLGMSHAVWNRVIPHLCGMHRVIAFDIAGFGLTPPLPRGIAPSVTTLVDGLERSIEELGIKLPVDLVGNSLGGYMALEAANRGMARSVVAISPAGLWRDHPPSHVQHVFGAMRFVATKFRAPLKMMMRSALLREVALAVPISVGSRFMPMQDAIRAVEDLASSAAFEETFHHTRSPFLDRGIKVPVTVAFGNRDWILPTRSRYRKGLPAHTRWVKAPLWGHVPMWVDSIGVSQLILQGVQQL